MKRFYKQATVEEAESGYAVLLDGKVVHSPAKHKVVVPVRPLAEAIAEEWQNQGEQIDKNTLPYTGFASLVLDVVSSQREAMLDELVEYGETDLLFYREDVEQALEEQQRTEWTPWLDWAKKRFGTHYEISSGIMPVAQDAANREKHLAALAEWDGWKLGGLAAVVKPTTSFILSVAFMENQLDAAELFRLSQLEEAFNVQKWGEDAEAAERREHLKHELELAEKWRGWFA